MILSKRRFVKLLTFLGVASTAGNDGWMSVARAEIDPSASGNTGILRVSLSDFPALDSAGGSIRLALNPLRSNHLPSGPFHPVLINRMENGELIALNSECTHASCAVPSYNTSARAHICPCHGSRYRIDGGRISGPAPFDLECYESHEKSAGILEIVIARLGFTVAVSRSLESERVKLEFPARLKIRYEMVHRANLGDAWRQVRFATTETGPMDQRTLEGKNRIVSVYVGRSERQGFYAVRMVVQPL